MRLAREAASNLNEAIRLAQVSVEVAAAAAAGAKKAGSSSAATKGRGAAVADNGMRAREGWARAELAKLCLTGVSPEYVRW